MISKAHVISTLRLNGSSPQAEEGEIRQVLLSSAWSEGDVNKALLILKSETIDSSDPTKRVKTIFDSDEKLNPEKINSLLGLSFGVPAVAIKDDELQNVGSSQYVSLKIIFFSILIAGLILGTGYLYVEGYFATLVLAVQP